MFWVLVHSHMAATAGVGQAEARAWSSIQFLLMGGRDSVHYSHCLLGLHEQKAGIKISTALTV